MPPDQSIPTWPQLCDEQVEAANRVLRSGQLNYWTGNEGKQFEREYADYVGQPHAIAVSNGTVALELALQAYGIGPGDEVIVPARTFIATASCVVARGAKPVCADVDTDSQNITADTVAAQITPRTRAVIPVHLAGWPCDMPAICELAARHKLLVVEDCSQAHGAQIGDRHVGSFGDAAAFSFCQDKIITTAGEGGMLLLRDEIAWRRAWSYKDHGKDYDEVHRHSSGNGFRWLHHSFGTNGRMTEVQAAVGRVALRHLEDWVSKRRSNAAALTELLRARSELRIPSPPSSVRHSYYKWYAFLRPSQLAVGWSRDRLLNAVTDRGAKCYSGSCGEIYLERAFRDIHPHGLRLPKAQELADTSLMLLVDPLQSDAAVRATADDLIAALEMAASSSTDDLYAA
ncbi:L-glutamine:2-deoxy-scyllo-inosose aminotransferase [Botrimarina colliarenosi]|uniref:L-glutamine:2-deoxy-scyllo-inosose aminotransferase n=1 Tax=Botrimarina colliarenosi TaxID=2528001 RepID=A0A5C6AMU5_9BACT|nr:DegT/DnrJ/EryC1/StrS family aminotransferase [Botrimarina colliarenosi]TWT99493.1 L-glutamine:2-deoxy-scyllo-inosose aminotransferase [Botrimarina colliarenosi]